MEHWVTTWGMAPADASERRNLSWAQGMLWTEYRPLNGRTFRYSYGNNLNGSAARVLFSNRESCQEMDLGAASLCAGGGEPVPLTFGGEKAFILAPGEECLSDPVPLGVRAGEPLTVSMFLKKVSSSVNNFPGSVMVSRFGDYTLSPQFDKDPEVTLGTRFVVHTGVARIDLLCEETAGAVAFFGDSIVQQCNWLTWVDGYLGFAHPGRYSVVNLGIGGNRLLHGPLDGVSLWRGRAGIDRFERDALSLCGGEILVFLIGTNDLGHVEPDHPEWVTAEQLAEALEDLADKARRGGYRKVVASTVLPFRGRPSMSDPRKETERLRLNELLRASAAFDALLDMDGAVGSRVLPGAMRPAADSGDHLHPGPLGGRLMAGELIRVMNW